MSKTNLISTLVVLALVAASATGIADDDHDHGGENTANGGDFGGLGLLWFFETEDDHHHHYEVFALATNGFSQNGVLVADGDHDVIDSGIQLHDACIIPGFDIEHDLLEAYEDATGEHEPYYPYEYIIADPDEVGFNDAGAIEAASWFWAQLGVDIYNHHALHDACEDDLGGEFVHSDLILLQEDHHHD